jgi:hypothetical protein
MTVKALRFFTTLASVGVLGATLVYSPVSQAFNFGDMMNPGKWMGGGNGDRYYDDDYGPYGGPYGGGPWGGGPYGYGGPWGGGPWGGGPYGYGGPWGGYGRYGGVRRYAAPAAPSAPAAAPQPKSSSSSSSSSSSNVRDAQIEALKRRIDQLEAQQQAPPPRDWGSSSSQKYRDWTMGSGPRKSGSSSGSSEDWSSAPVFRPLGKY